MNARYFSVSALFSLLWLHGRKRPVVLFPLCKYHITYGGVGGSDFFFLTFHLFCVVLGVQLKCTLRG